MIQSDKQKIQKQKIPKDNIKTYKILNIARSGHGKTFNAINFLKNLIQNKELEPERLVIFSSTIRINPPQLEFVNWLQNKITKKNKKDLDGKTYDYVKQNTAKEVKYEFLDKLYKTQEKLKENDRKTHHWFIYFDDLQADSNNQLFNGNDILKKVFLQGRHLFISIMINLQSYRSSLQPILKDQVNLIFLGDLNSQEAKQDMIKQYSSGFDQDNPKNSSNKLFQEFTKILQMNNNHGMLQINSEIPTSQGRFQIAMTDQFLDK